MNFQALLINYHEAAAVIVFCIGFMTLMLHPNLIKKVIGVNLSSSSMFLFFAARGYIEGGEATILDPVTLEAPAVMVDLIPTGPDPDRHRRFGVYHGLFPGDHAAYLQPLRQYGSG